MVVTGPAGSVSSSTLAGSTLEGREVTPTSLLKSFTKRRAHACPVCESRFAGFQPAHNRPAAKCPGCGSLERHRLAWLFLQRETDLFAGRPLSLLHAAPEPMLKKRFRALNHLEYLSIDIESPIADEKMDMTQLDLDDETFDCTYCSHVLEHIPDDRAAMGELYRILRPGGWGLLLVPILRETTYEDPAIVDPADRLEAFGQADHVRKYGRDFADRLQSVGFSVEEIPYAATLDRQTSARYGLDVKELVHFCRKPRAGGEEPGDASGVLESLRSPVRP